VSELWRYHHGAVTFTPGGLVVVIAGVFAVIAVVGLYVTSSHSHK
jgi:hypothetical protein